MIIQNRKPLPISKWLYKTKEKKIEWQIQLLPWKTLVTTTQMYSNKSYLQKLWKQSHHRKVCKSTRNHCKMNSLDRVMTPISHASEKLVSKTVSLSGHMIDIMYDVGALCSIISSIIQDNIFIQIARVLHWIHWRHLPYCETRGSVIPPNFQNN